MAEYNRRVDGHPYTKGSDCNMLVYDAFYGIDMPVLISEVMNSGFSGVAAWMLDDAMHSQGDSGQPQDIKIWGMWNILGSEVFGDPSQEDVRPWYYTWSLMCRYFPKGCNVLDSRIENPMSGIFVVAALTKENKISMAVINTRTEKVKTEVSLPRKLAAARLFRYSEKDGISLDRNGLPKPEGRISGSKKVSLELEGNSMVLVTEMD